MKKVCPRCKVEKQSNLFGFRANGSLRSWCKKCKRAHDKNSYHTKPAQKESVRKSNREHIRRNKEFVRAYLLTHPCVDCGERDIIVLDFDHVRGNKINDVALMANNGWSLKSIQTEISKCEVRCANDHRRRTHERRQVRLEDSVIGSTALSESVGEGSNPSPPTIFEK